MNSKWREVFKEDKVIIGMVHLPPLPGTPLYNGSEINQIMNFAVKEAVKLEKGGINGVMVENFGDKPFRKYVGPETVATMSVICKEITGEVNVPVGVNVLRNDSKAALAIAKAADCKFIRANVQTGVYVTDQGLIEGKAFETHMFRKIIGAENVLILADVLTKQGSPLSKRGIGDEAYDLVDRGLADAVIVTGARTGLPPNLELVKNVKEALREGVVLIGSGLNSKNCKKFLEIADGAIVGTSLKKRGEIDAEKVKDLMRKVKGLV